jgi:predicted O-linked N-acetylglucosamine transferase (SPINDLY family)
MLRKQRHLDPAIAAFREALRLKPDSAIPWLNLASAVTEVGQLDEALACLDRAIALEPADPTFHSARLFTLMFHPAFDAGAILDAARAFDRRYGEPCKPLIVPHENDPSPGRRLRIGYVSPDFKGHCQLLFMMPLLAAHDREAVEVFCYSNVVEPDNLTDQYRAHADTWRNIRGISDADAAEMIRQDRIDILVDLTMHMKDNRLPLFARKPAPLQVSWLAYPGTTGLSAIDYRLTDPYLDPPGLNDADYSERSIHLPDCFWCFDPMQSDLPVGPLPALSAGHVTFGCLNNFCKVNEPVLITWAQVLQNVAESRLLLLAPDGGTRERVIEILQRQGVARERVEFVPFQSRGRYLREYCRIDIGLDTFPYNGHTTSLDSFWMGVPVVTLVGRTVVGRAGWCQLSNLGLVELATNNSDQFVQTAGALARDLQRLGEYRSSLRERMERSPLMNIPRFARNIESAFRTMWRHWCAGQR